MLRLSEKMLERIPCLVIHREQDKERLPVIQALEEKLGRPLQLVEGVNGVFLVEQGMPQKHPLSRETTTPGNLGCTATHCKILDGAIRSTFDAVCLFEDDAEMICSTEELEAYFARMDEIDPKWDILFLGVNEIVEMGEEPPVVAGIASVRRFWGTHAVIVRRRAMVAILDMYKTSIEDGYGLPADWLYSYAIKRSSLKAYAPFVPLVRQKPGLLSLISGSIRK